MPFLDAELIRDVIGSRPAAGSKGRRFTATDENKEYYDDGSAWQAIAIAASQIVGAPAGSLQKYATSWSSQTSVTVTHNLGSSNVTVQVYDNGSPVSQVTPESITINSANVVTLTFGASFSGSVVVIG